ncbi:MAG: NifB/NifX family molybdenum-iron cluster-binding protein [Methanobacteriota archaeon]
MPMRIAVPASGPSVNDQVDTRFERAPFIIFITPETGEISHKLNPCALERGGLEPHIVQFLIKNQVTHLIAPRIVGHANNALLAAGILVFLWEGSGSVSSALKRFNIGNLTLMAENPHAS